MLLCPKCQKWEIGKQDVFCSWCRWKLVDFEVALSARHVYHSPFAADLELTVTHTGSVGALSLDAIESNQPWLKVNKQVLADPTLRQGQSKVLPVEIETASLADDYHTATITVSSAIGAKAVTLEVVPAPEIKASVGEDRNEYTILLDGEGEEAVASLLTLARGIVTVRDIATDVDWARVELDEQVKLPVKLDARSQNELPFKLLLDQRHLLSLSGQRFPAEFSGQLRVTYAELEPPERDCSFYIKCILPPKLTIPEGAGLLKLPLFTDRRSEFSLTLQNGESEELSRAELFIHGMQADAAWLRCAEPPAFPLLLSGGESHKLKFTVVANEIGEGKHNAKVTFLTNQAGPMKEKDVFIEVTVTTMEDYDGVLAIDFGTVNSCCAFIDSKGQIRLIDIDLQNEKPDVAPSTILYWKKLEDDSRDYDIGLMPYQYSFDPLAAASTVRQIKRRLGQTEPIGLTYFHSPEKEDHLLPREITADIIRRILERAENVLGARIRQCVVSHPSCFSLRQISDLKAALVACGIEGEKITTMHEPLGAAMEYIYRNTSTDQAHEYHLMVYDFGGGTTDVTLLRVNVRPDPARKMVFVTPTVLGATGDRWLGGEDVTEMILEIALEKCRLILQDFHSGAEVLIPIEANQLNSPFHKGPDPAKDNLIQLRRWAEPTKVALSRFGDRHIEEERGLNPPLLNVLVDGQLKTQLFSQKDVAPLVAELEERLMPRLQELIAMMKRLVRNNSVEVVDVILLSGQSSSLPIVEKAIREAFSDQNPEPAIRTPADLKKCVVRGACHLFDPNPIANIYIDVDDSSSLSATTSRIGMRISDFGETRFKELIDAGSPIPDSGLKVQVTDIVLRRNAYIRLLENSGLKDEMVINGRENPNIAELQVFRLDHKLTEWERANNAKVTNQMLIETVIELEVTPNLSVRLLAKVPGIEQPFEFEAELTGW